MPVRKNPVATITVSVIVTVALAFSAAVMGYGQLIERVDGIQGDIAGHIEEDSLHGDLQDNVVLNTEAIQSIKPKLDTMENRQQQIKDDVTRVKIILELLAQKEGIDIPVDGG